MRFSFPQVLDAPAAREVSLTAFPGTISGAPLLADFHRVPVPDTDMRWSQESTIPRSSIHPAAKFQPEICPSLQNKA